MQDDKYMTRAIELSRKSFERLDMPIGCVIVHKNEIVAESENYALTNKDFTQHAEVLTMLQTTKKLNSTNLSECTLYTTMEPCPMCSLLIREYRISRVVFALYSTDMGGYSKYPILTDVSLSQKYPKHFGDVPEIKKGFLEDEAAKIWIERKEMKDKGEVYKQEKY